MEEIRKYLYTVETEFSVIGLLKRFGVIQKVDWISQVHKQDTQTRAGSAFSSVI